MLSHSSVFLQFLGQILNTIAYKHLVNKHEWMNELMNDQVVEVSL